MAFDGLNDRAAYHGRIGETAHRSKLLGARDPEAHGNGQLGEFAKTAYQFLRIFRQFPASSGNPGSRDAVNKPARSVGNPGQPFVGASRGGEEDGGETPFAHVAQVWVSLFDGEIRDQSAVHPGLYRALGKLLDSHAK